MKQLFDIEEKPGIFEAEFPLQLDKKKKNILIYINHRVDEYQYSFGHFNLIIEALNDVSNVIVLSDKNIGVTFSNHLKLSRAEFSKLNKEKFKRKAQDSNSTEINTNALLEAIANSFVNLPIHKFIITDDNTRMLPQTTYVSRNEDEQLHEMKNEFHDYVGDDKDRIALIRKHTTNIDKNFNSKVSILAYSMWKVNLYYNVGVYLHSTGNLEEIIMYTLDPTGYSQNFRDLGIKVKEFYYVNDKRGIRDFTQYPIPELQHLVYDDKLQYTPKDLTKSKNFIFAGTVLQEKGNRTWVWGNFLKDLNIPDSSLYVPIRTNGIFKNERSKKGLYATKSKDKATSIFPELVKEIESHPNYGGYIFPHDLLNETAKYKYGFIARCVSFYDSLNYRPILYLNLNVLPILDNYYDPDYLQIPKEIQDKIVVHNSDDITNMINYYNNNESERMEIINKLKEHFQFEDVKENWVDIIRNKILN